MSNPAIEVKNLWFRYPNGIIALQGIDLDLYLGEIVAIVGPNGSGKTTLVKHFNGLLKPSKGYVKVFGMDTRFHKVSELARYVGIVFQNPMHYFLTTSVEEEITVTTKLLGLDISPQRVKEIARILRIDHLLDKPPHTLSLGEQRRVVIASVLVRDPPLLVLDEPTAGLDLDAKLRLAFVLRDLRSRGHGVVVVTHDMEFLAKLKPDRIVVLVTGRKVFDGKPRDIFYRIDELYTFNLVPPQIPELFHRFGVDDRYRPLDEEEALEFLAKVCRDDR